MSYLAIARKWRPTQFEDLVGQSHIVQTLKNAVTLNRVSHAYLFSGGRGVGKTSVARIFAKALRCPNAKDAVPCNHCDECQLISDSRSVDVAEIDGASNNGVEAVRSVRDNVAYGAATGHYKIYIIDEVHMLSISAFNALLKTLEEPPPHVIFIFATTEVQKIPLTILSRCQRFEFKRLTQEQILQRLHTVLNEEKVKIEEEGLRTLASHADGSLRDALSLLDQVLSFLGGSRVDEVTNGEVVQALGISDAFAVTRYWSAIFNKDVKELLKVIEENHASGADLKYFAEKSLEELRLIYLAFLSKESGETITADKLDISTARFNEILGFAEKTNLFSLERMAQILSKVITQLTWASLPRFAIEMASVRMLHLDALEKKEAVALPVKKVVELKPVAAAVRPVAIAEPIPDPVEIVEDAPADPNTAWKSFVEFTMKKRPLLGALLSHANFKMQDKPNGKAILIAFPEGSFYAKQASDSKNLQDILEHVKVFFGPETQVVMSNVLQSTVQSLQKTRDEEVEAVKKVTLENPIVSQVKELLGAEVVEVRVDG